MPLSVFACSSNDVHSVCESYDKQSASWPQKGRHLLAYWDTEGVVVYQAFNKSIAEYAATNQTFKGCPGYSFTRMTWIKTNFMWMMYRCGWGVKDSDQERVLALKVSHEGFRSILQEASKKGGSEVSTVRLQWDPDHAPSGRHLQRQAIQLGLKGEVARNFLENYLIRVEDITETLVRSQWHLVLPSAMAWMQVNKGGVLSKKKWSAEQEAAWQTFTSGGGADKMPSTVSQNIFCPLERIYPVSDSLSTHLEMVEGCADRTCDPTTDSS